MRRHLETEPSFAEALRQLKGKRLGCWCKSQACPGDVLVELPEGIEKSVSEEQLPLV